MSFDFEEDLDYGIGAGEPGVRPNQQSCGRSRSTHACNPDANSRLASLEINVCAGPVQAGAGEGDGSKGPVGMEAAPMLHEDAEMTDHGQQVCTGVSHACAA